MIVCSCNVLSDHAIRRSVGGRHRCPGRVSEVFDHHGCRPQCGRCAVTIRRLLRESIADDHESCPALIDDIAIVIADAAAAPTLLAAE